MSFVRARPAAVQGARAANAGLALGAWGFDTTAMDASVAPGDDFDRYANGARQARTKIPDDAQSVSMFTQGNALVQSQLRALLEEAAADAQTRPGSLQQVLGDWYGSFMDEPTIEAVGVTPLKPVLDRIAAIGTRVDLARYLGERAGYPRAEVFAVCIAPDEKNSRAWRAEVLLEYQGLSLGQPEAYTSASQASRRSQYLAHVERMIDLAGLDNAKARAARAVALETKIAAALPAEQDRPVGDAAYNRVAPREFGRRFPGIDWDVFLGGADVISQPTLLVGDPKALAAGARLVAGEPLDAWRDYLTYQCLKRAVDVLPRAFRDAHFDFYTRSLGLQAQPRPRHVVAIEIAQEELTRFLGEAYVTRYAMQNAKAAAVAMVAEIQRTFDGRLERSPWLSDSSWAEARKKLAATRGMIENRTSGPPPCLCRWCAGNRSATWNAAGCGSRRGARQTGDTARPLRVGRGVRRAVLRRRHR